VHWYLFDYVFVYLFIDIYLFYVVCKQMNINQTNKYAKEKEKEKKKTTQQNVIS